MEVTYVCQGAGQVAGGPHGARGPGEALGSSHAVLCCKDVIDAPFCAINGDDLYGLDAMQQMYTFLKSGPRDNEYAMVGFELRNTLSDHGYVSAASAR